MVKKRKKYAIKGTRKTERGLGYQTDIITAKSWNHAVAKARRMGWGVKSDFDVKLIKK